MKIYLHYTIILLSLTVLLGLAACSNTPTPTLVVQATATEPPATSTPIPTASPVPPTAQPTATPTLVAAAADTPIPLPAIESALTTEEQLRQANIPGRDLNLLALKFREGSKSGQEAAIEVKNNFSLNDTDDFWITDNSSGSPAQFQIRARVAYITDHAYWWVQEGYDIPQVDLQSSGTVFENDTYPTTRTYFGSEPSPGVDNDVHVHIVMGNIPGVAGYYASSNQYSQLVDEYSNQREMFLINLDAIKPGNINFDSILAHEFQHMIHWNNDPDEDTWINEGFSELARLLNGYTTIGAANVYLNQPDLQLTGWGTDSSRGGHYGYSFLFSAYLYDKFGPEAITTIVAHPQNGGAGVAQALQAFGVATTFDEIFADFIVANYLNDPNLGQGQWGYTIQNFNIEQPTISVHHHALPVEGTGTVHQYGADYINIDGLSMQQPAAIKVAFSGNPYITLLDNQAYSGRYQWYSNRGDSADTTLTQAFDLSGLSQATLQFRSWYNIEKDWDYAYVAVSTDGGEFWQIVPAISTLDTNPVGNAYGPGFTGASGQWLEESVDLTPFVGQEILLRFEYVTDDAINMPGFAIDDIQIPELNFFDDAESGDGGWLSEGFIRTDNQLRQRYVVPLITFDQNNQPTVNRIALDENGQGEIVVPNFGGEVRQAILVVSAQAPTTSSQADYTYSISILDE